MRLLEVLPKADGQHQASYLSTPFPPFCFKFVEIPLKKSRDIPCAVQELGAKAIQYATALKSLAAAGNKEARIALKLLTDEARRIQKARVAPKFDANHWNHIAPVNLDPIKRWEINEAGILALQLLLWLWQAHLNPSLYGIIGRSLSNPFSLDSLNRWWLRARVLFLHFYPKPEQVPELARLVTAPSVKGSAKKERQDILGKIRDHFKSFAPFVG